MTDLERRKFQQHPGRMLERQLNDDQLLTLREIERFGWELKFMRRRPFELPIPVVFDGDRKKFGILEPDGTLNENPNFEIRR